jgi:hypothetical protein
VLSLAVCTWSMRSVSLGVLGDCTQSHCVNLGSALNLTSEYLESIKSVLSLILQYVIGKCAYYHYMYSESVLSCMPRSQSHYQVKSEYMQ